MSAGMSPNVTKAVHECLAFHEALRRLGYLSADIFVQVAPGQLGLSAWVLLRVRGLPEVRLLAGPFSSETEAVDFEKAWPSQVVAWNKTMTEEDRGAIYGPSFVRANAMDFILMLIKKGHPLMPPSVSVLM